MGDDKIIREGSDSDTERAKQGRKSFEEGHSFENRVDELYRLLRYDVEHGRIFSGRQVDLFLTGRFGDLIVYRAIECKTSSIKAEHIDSFIAKLRLVRREYPAAPGTMVSAVSFTDAITAHAAQEGIQLTLFRDLAAQLFDGHGYAQNIVRECETNNRYPIPLYIEPYIGYDLVGTSISAFKAVDEWLKDSQWNQLTLLGDVGTGKSFLSRMLAYKLAKNFLEQPLERPVPILIDLRNADRQFSIEGLVLTHLAQNGLTRVSFEAFQHALSHGNIILILDGFDEMAARVTPLVTNRNFHELARCVQGRAKVLLTCRTHYFRSRTEEEEVILGSSQDYGSETARDLYWELISRKGFKIAYLRSFNVSQIEEYVQRAKPNQAKVALDRIRSTYNLMELSQRPMLLEMIVKSVDRLSVTEINPATLYMVFTDAWIHRDQWRDVLSPEAKLAFLTGLAHSLWHEDAVSIHYSRLTEYLQNELASQIQNPQQLIEIDSEIRTASFLTRDDSGNYGFAHKSYAEFFLARYLADEFNHGRLDCLHTRRYSPETISFLKYLLDLPKVQSLFENILLNEYRPLTSENALICLYGFQRDHFLYAKQSHKEISPDKLVVTLPSRVQLRGAQLDQVTLEGALLINADLSNANLSQAVLTRADLSNASMNSANLEKAYLTNSILSSTQLKDASLIGANLEGADLRNANLVGANLSDAFLLKTICEGASLENAIFTNAVLPDELAIILCQIPDDEAFRRGILVKSGGYSTEHHIILERLYPIMMSIASRFSLFLNSDANELVHEATIALLSARSLEKLRGLDESQQQGYAYGVIKNIATSDYKNLKKQRTISSFDTFDSDSEASYIPDYHYNIPSADISPLDRLIASETKEISMSEIEGILPAEFWRILKARYIDGCKLNEIAAREELSLSTVHRYISKAREIVRKHFE
ncbi:MAG: sigma-70 family RNA polymerase sigma factor [Proteobacteria bacterium]|nr:sigma-70 family RNA polymerase sigma factor [Pseudomonadota bacterium]